jgi:hypothetical protein
MGGSRHAGGPAENGGMANHPPQLLEIVMRGLDPRIHVLQHRGGRRGYPGLGLSAGPGMTGVLVRVAFQTYTFLCGSLDARAIAPCLGPGHFSAYIAHERGDTR